MRYPIVIHHEPGTAYGVTVPDIPGCFSAGDTFDEALDNTREAISGHLSALADRGEVAPAATSVDAHLNNPDYAGGVWAIVDLDVSAFMGKCEKVTVTLPSLLVKKIEDEVRAGRAKNRSSFLADSVAKAMMQDGRFNT